MMKKINMDAHVKLKSFQLNLSRCTNRYVDLVLIKNSELIDSFNPFTPKI